MRRFAIILTAAALAATASHPIHAQPAGDSTEPPACDPADAAMAAPAVAPDTLESAAAEARPAVLEGLVGEWQGSGVLFGSEATFAMRWERILDGRFLELRYEIRGPVRMGARAHYLLGAPDLRGSWIDTRGEFLDLAATATDSTLATEWSSPSETGRTVYRLTGPAALEVCDFVRDAEGWRPFGAARYTRIR